MFLVGIKQLMFYQLEVNGVHTISASACVLIRILIYHPGNVWFCTVKVTLLIQMPSNLTKYSSTRCVSFNIKLMAEAEKDWERWSWWNCSLILYFVAPSFEGWENTGINELQLCRCSSFPELCRWGSRWQITFRKASVSSSCEWRSPLWGLLLLSLL